MMNYYIDTKCINSVVNYAKDPLAIARFWYTCICTDPLSAGQSEITWLTIIASLAYLTLFEKV